MRNESKQSVNPKSIIIGSLLTICILLGSGATGGGGNGRYSAFVPNPTNRDSFCVIDTQTGQVWQRYQGPETFRVPEGGRIVDYGTPHNPKRRLEETEEVLK